MNVVGNKTTSMDSAMNEISSNFPKIQQSLKQSESSSLLNKQPEQNAKIEKLKYIQAVLQEV